MKKMALRWKRARQCATVLNVRCRRVTPLIKKRKKEVSGILTIRCLKSNGIDIIKSALISSGSNVFYIGAPHYMISEEGDDFKKCEKKMRSSVEKITKEIEKSGGTCTFEKKEET